MHHPHNASPDEPSRSNCNELFRIGSLFLAACFLISFFMVPAVSAASRRGAKTLSASPAAVTKERTALAAKAKPVAVAKAGSSARKPKKAVDPPKPLVSEATKTKAEAITSEIATELPENVENEITKFFGLRYRFGGEGPGGIDCSALIKQVYSEIFGINLPRRSTEQSQMGSLEPVDKGELKTGDLVFFGPDRKAVNHVGMYLAGGHFLHAARSEGVTISRLDNSYWKSRYMFSKRARGLDLGDEQDEDLDFDRMLAMYSFSSGVGAGHALDNFSFLETGVQLNDSLEFILSGFMMNALETSGAPADPYSPEAVPATESSEFESGFRLAAAISPLEWIRLVPSITQVDEDKQDKGSGRDYQKLGLETWMILPSSKVAVFMAAHARNQEDLLERPLGVSPDWQNMDFALGLHYHLSDSLRFSLWGTQTANTDLRANEEPGRRNSPVEDVSFQFNFRF